MTVARYAPLLMKAQLLERPNDPFRLVDVPRPAPGPGEVLVRIHASGVNPLDTKIRAGSAAHARHPLPAILGIDLAGVVEELGEGVSAFRPGDAVYGMTGGVGGVPGSLAELAAVDSRLLARKPANLSMRQAAALPLVAITAWEGLVDRARVSSGHRVLVQGGSGGVGHVAVQLARALGADVHATASAKDFEEVSRLGATPIDRTLSVGDQVKRHASGEGFDVVFDTVGGKVLDASFEAVRRFGHVVSILGWGTHALAPLSFKGGTYSGVFTLLPLLTGVGREHHGEILSRIAALVEGGKLSPRLDPRTFRLADAEAAHAAVASGGAAGKVVVTVVER
ncbi:MAG TPA: zinc-dependent alcohol dehydrogenase family protein [Myxococcaceae bacterium]|nr:zinc-dependent alcohol dehydrogenase family protein [Myxococcaceae bacterium]